MLKNIFITILLICSVSGVWGQKSVKVKVSGNVITTDGVPAEFINIQLKNTFYGGTSDGKGYFEFMAPAGQYTMIVQSIAAHRREFPVTIEEGKENHFADIEIRENINQLEQVHVRCLIDECANIGQIPKLEKLVATIRSREISACLVLQAQSQLKAIYKDNADTIIGNMDTSIFLGGKEPTTLKELAAVLGKETIDTYNTGENRGRETSHSLNYQKLGKELMSQDELAVMDGGKCILQLRGVRPFLSDKYDITKHPNYPYTADADPKNAFDIEAFLSTRLKLNPNEVYDVYEVDAEGA